MPDEHEVATVELIFAIVRRVVVFGLGCWVIGNALVNPEERATQLIIGMIMVGVLPIENIFGWRRQPTRQEGGDNGR
jgi:hypothetical protein